VNIIGNISLCFVVTICIGADNLKCLIGVLKPSLRINYITIITYLQTTG